MCSYSSSDWSPKHLGNCLSLTYLKKQYQIHQMPYLVLPAGKPTRGCLQRARAALLDALQRRLRRRHQGRGRQGRRRTLHPELHAQHIHRCKSLPAFLLLMLFFFLCFVQFFYRKMDTWSIVSWNICIGGRLAVVGLVACFRLAWSSCLSKLTEQAFDTLN